MKPHKHADLIKLWADGHAIQRNTFGNSLWVDDPNPKWCKYDEFRVKPPNIPADHGEVYESHWKRKACPEAGGYLATEDKGFLMFLYVYDGETGVIVKKETIASFDIERGWFPREHEIRMNRHLILPKVRLEYKGSLIWMRDIVDEHNRSIEQTSKE